jgi:dTDP-4-amino-4,6-dideoxygalactose transaminase
VWARYDDAFAGLPLTLPSAPETGTRHARHLYTVLVDEKVTGISRDAFLEGMTEHAIGVGVHYMSIPEHPYYQSTYGWKPEDYPNAMLVGRQTVSLPISAKLLPDDVDDVMAAVTALLL